MRFALESSSEASTDEDYHIVARTPSATPSKSRTASASASSASRRPVSASSTPKRGILRNSTTAQTPTPTSHQNQNTPRPTAHFSDATVRHTPHQSPVRTRRASSNQFPIQPASQKRGESPFERVGLASQATLRPDAAGPSAKSSTAPPPASRTELVPPWLRPEQQLPRGSDGARGLLDDASDSSSDASDDSSEASSSSFPSTSSVDGAYSDSEEEEWPVEPGRIGRAEARAYRADRPQGRRKRDLARRIRMASVADEWEDWDRLSRESALSRATTSYVERLRTFSSGAPLQEQSPASPSNLLQQKTRQGSLKPAQALARQGTGSAALSSADDDLDEVRKLLSSLNVKREDEERKEREAFEARNRLLWQGIDASILAAEKEAQEAAAAEAQRLAAARKAQEEAERRAKEQRENEQKRIEAEKKAKAEEAKRKKEEEEHQKAEAEAQQRAEKEKSMDGGGDDVRKAAEQEYEGWMAKITHIKQNVLPTISQNPELRKQCFAAKRQITPKVGQLTNSQQEIVRITNAIGAVLASAKTASPTGEIYTWILNHLSKCLIRQAEQEVAAKQDTAYPLARVVVWLLLQGHGELGEVLMARLVKKCCWCLAVWPRKRKDQDDESYRKLLGYRSNDESNENYSNRMAGIFAFYVAILQTQPTAPPSAPTTTPDVALVPEYLRSKMLWIWSVRTLSSGSPVLSHPLLPSLWSTFLEVGGNRALSLYGKQMGKAWRLMLDDGIRGKKAGFVQKGEEEGYIKASIIRLQLLLEGWEKQGRIVDATKGVEMEQP
ncbi:Nuclear pore complex nucleoporin component [Thecaphora frezii]